MTIEVSSTLLNHANGGEIGNGITHQNGLIVANGASSKSLNQISASINNNNNNKKSRNNTDHSDCRGTEIKQPPDGGFRAWFLILPGAFLCNGIIFGIINTYSVIYKSLQKQLTEAGDLEASSKAGIII